MSTKQKLELTWIGKGQDPKLEPRILIEDTSKSYGDKNSDNMLIHGDNLLALKALEQEFTGKIKCIYIDPPYNTGSAFEHYDDNLEHSTWLNLMKPRLEILKKLLSTDGVIYIQIDDNEQAYLRVLMDEVFGRSNFINTISVNMKNVAGASGGGEDKKLKKNIEYIHIYSRNYLEFDSFKNSYDLILISDLTKQYKEEGKSWKYTSVLVYDGEKEYIGSTVDGDGNEIKIYKRLNSVIKSINQVAKDEKLSEDDVYSKYAEKIFQTAMPQSSIRPRVMEKIKDLGITGDIFSIEYVPKSGRNKGKVYEQFYKGDKLRLFAWLKDVAEEKDGKLYKKELQGTYWNFVGETKNLTKEGSVEFPNGKKPELLIQRIIEMSTEKGDYVLDSFLGSGTTVATAHKLQRKWIGIERGEHAYTHCIPRLHSVIDGTDQSTLSKNTNWHGGGGFRFYKLAPSLIVKDKYGKEIINPEYNPNMLASAVCKHMGFNYSPDPEIYWKQGKSTETDYIFTTTQYVTIEMIDTISSEMRPEETLLVSALSYDPLCESKYSNINIKKIPQSILGKCEFSKDNYDLNIINSFEEINNGNLDSITAENE